MVLSDIEISIALDNAQLVIDPRPQPGAITTSAVDLHLASEFKTWIPPEGGVSVEVDPSHPQFSFEDVAREYLRDVPLTKGVVVIDPGVLILGRTEERVGLPIQGRLAARVEGRSTLARLGLAIHISAPTIHAGFRGTITLEMLNVGKLPLRLRPGLNVCQLIVEQVLGTPSRQMTGVFQDQKSVVGQ